MSLTPIPCLNDEEQCPEYCPCDECVDLTAAMSGEAFDPEPDYDERHNYALGSAATGIGSY